LQISLKECLNVGAVMDTLADGVDGVDEFDTGNVP
jgi:hypothetical protein